MIKKHWLPREHGAWVMLLVPLFLGSWLASFSNHWGWLGAFQVLFVFLLRQPVTWWIKTRRRKNLSEKKSLMRAAFVYTLLSGVCFFVLVWVAQRHLLLAFVPVVCLLGAIYAWFVFQKQEMSVLSEMVGVFGLSFGFSFQYVVMTNSWNVNAFKGSLLCFLYFASTVFFVKLKSKKQSKVPNPRNIRGKLWTGKELLFFTFFSMTVVICFFPGSWFLWTAFVFSWCKNVIGIFHWQTPETLSFPKIGIMESLLALAFLVFLGLSFPLIFP